MFYKDKKILVTGGTGMIGRQLVKMLCDAGAIVRIASKDTLNVDERAEHQLIDLMDFERCKEVTKSMDYVFHLAGVKGSPKVTQEKPASFFVPFLMMNTNILEACRLNNVERVLYTSTIGAYADNHILAEENALDDEPMDTFPGWAKRMGEFQIETYKIQYGLTNFAIVRPTNVYGIGDNFDPNSAMVIPSLIAKIYRGDNPLMVWGDGKQIRDFLYSKDVARGMLLALEHGCGAGVINLGGGKGITIKEVIEKLASFVDFNYEFDKSKPTGIQSRVMATWYAKRVLGFEPEISLLDGLKETWEWFIKNPDEHLKKQNYFKTS